MTNVSKPLPKWKNARWLYKLRHDRYSVNQMWILPSRQMTMGSFRLLPRHHPSPPHLTLFLYNTSTSLSLHVDGYITFESDGDRQLEVDGLVAVHDAMLPVSPPPPPPPPLLTNALYTQSTTCIWLSHLRMTTGSWRLMVLQASTMLCYLSPSLLVPPSPLPSVTPPIPYQPYGSLTFQPDDDGQLEVDGLAGVHDALGDGGAVQDAAEHVHQNDLHLGKQRTSMVI